MIIRFITVVLLMLASFHSQAAREVVDNVMRGVERQIPQKMPNIPKNIQQPQPMIPQETLQRINQHLQQLDNKALNSINPLAQLANKVPIANRHGGVYLTEVMLDDGWRAVEKEWIIMLDAANLEQIKRLPLSIVEQEKLDGLRMHLVRIKVDEARDSYATIKDLLPEHLAEQLERNYVYEASSSQQNSSSDSVGNTKTINKTKTICHKPLTVGMIDTAVETTHPAFAQSTIKAKNFMPSDLAVPTGHGTAIAGLFVGRGEVNPLLPEATLFSASVFYPRNDYSQGATLMTLLKALNWLVDKQVDVINMSLTGPDNRLLKTAIKRVSQQGHIVVAAAGNEGPVAAPMYPAAYPEVVAVTAVDHKKNIYRWANQGDYVDFAALGVGVMTTRADKGFGTESGTSIATPVVAAHVACQANAKEDAMTLLRQKAIDLGQLGKDSVFGDGFLE